MGKYISNVYGFLNGCRKTLIIKVINRKFVIGKSLRLLQGAQLNLYQDAKGNIGDGVKIDPSSTVVCVSGGELIIDNSVGIGPHNFIICREKISIGENTIFGPNVFVYDHDHKFDSVNGVNRNEYNTGEVVIGKNCWIGANTVILRNTHIGDNCLIAAGSTIKGNIAAGSIVVQKRNNAYLKAEGK